MEKKNDGGPAFPFNRDSSYEQLTPEEEGMSLRDYFAGQAMQSLIISGWSIDDVTTQRAYFMADAMIIQRDK